IEPNGGVASFPSSDRSFGDHNDPTLVNRYPSHNGLVLCIGIILYLRMRYTAFGMIPCGLVGHDSDILVMGIATNEIDHHPAGVSPLQEIEAVDDELPIRMPFIEYVEIRRIKVIRHGSQPFN